MKMNQVFIRKAGWEKGAYQERAVEMWCGRTVQSVKIRLSGIRNDRGANCDRPDFIKIGRLGEFLPTSLIFSAET